MNMHGSVIRGAIVRGSRTRGKGFFFTHKDKLVEKVTLKNMLYYIRSEAG